MSQSGITFHIDATEGASRRLRAGLTIQGPFESTTLTLHFPRWVPGSYFLREPIQHMTEFSALDQDGNELSFKRYEVDAMKVKIAKETRSVTISYKLLATELSCRSNHLDSSHLHMMPPFTWFLPSAGIDSARMNMNHEVVFHAPKEWTPATQFELTGSVSGSGDLSGNDGTTWTYTTPNRDELLDGIIEANPNENLEWKVEGRSHILKFWDSGGHSIDSDMLEKFKDDMNKIIKEHHALFGIPPWDNYVTVIQLTEKARGGLEHLNSQTSMLPRQCMMKGHDDEYRDLVSLFSHEYLHQWNVKRLRPRNFLDYDLQREAHSDLLWWFEGCTSWLGDMLCVRSGAWSEEDWRKDLLRKMKRHTTRHGMESESLQESSHDAWIHLYRGHSFSRETQISYYLEGELAIMCLDSELRRRSKGEHGICDLMAILCEKHALEYDNVERLGVTHTDIRKALTSMKGGRNLGVMLDNLMSSREAPDVESALAYFGLELIPEAKEEEIAKQDGWLGIGLNDSTGILKVTTHHTGSPIREIVMPGDEIISLNGFRCSNAKSLQSCLKGNAGNTAELIFSHEGIITSAMIEIASQPHHRVKLKGKGNQKWRDYIATRQ